MGARGLVLFAPVLAACVGARAPAAPLPARRAVSAPPAARARTVAVAPTAPPGFELRQGDGFSLVAPADWTPVEVAGASLALAAVGGRSLRVARAPLEGAVDELVAREREGIEARGGEFTSRVTVVVEGQPAPVVLDTYRMTPPGPTIRGVLRVTSTSDHVVAVTCHTRSASWNDVARRACDPIFASVRLDPRGDSPAPRGARYLRGPDVRVTVPASWTDEATTAPGVVALARSSAAPEARVVVTVSEATPSGPLTPRTRDAEIAKFAAAMEKLPGVHASIKHVASNLADLDFTRTLPGPSTTWTEAYFQGAGATYVFVCGGPADGGAVDRVCKTALESMRVRATR